jgi:hypothetical protein
MVGRAHERQLELGPGQRARVRRPVAVETAPQARQDDGAAEGGSERERLAELQEGGSGPGARGALGSVAEPWRGFARVRGEP